MTNQQAIDKVMSRLTEGDSPANRIFPADILALIPDALQKFAIAVAGDSELAPLLRKDFIIAVTSGVGDLNASLTAAEPLLADSLPNAYLVTEDGVQLHYLPDRTQLNLNRPALIPYYINDKGVLRTRNVNDGSLTSLNTTVTATGQYTPTIADVPVQIDDLFISVLAQMVKEQMATEAPTNA